MNGVNDQYDGILGASVWCVEQTGNVKVFEALGFTIVKKMDSALSELTDGNSATEVQLQRVVTA